MTTQSQYTPEVVQLQGGLDLVTPRPTTAPGALIDCHNFEVSDVLGYSRVLGVEKFDGRDSQSLAYAQLYSAVASKVISAPVLSTAVPSGSGGTLGATNFEIVVTASTASGETTASNTLTAITTTGTSSIAVTWTAVTGAISYTVYYHAALSPGPWYKITSGSTSATITTTSVGTGTAPTINVATTTFTMATPRAMILLGDISNDTFGICTGTIPIGSTAYSTMYFYVTNFPKFYSLYTNVANNAQGYNFVDDLGNTYLVSSIINTQNTSGLTLAQYISNAVNQYTNVANKVEILGTQNLNGPNSTYNPAIGLQWYNDQLYAVADLNSFAFTDGKTIVNIGDQLHAIISGASVVVRDIVVTSGDWSTNNATGIIWYSLLFPSASSNLGKYNSATFGTANTLAAIGAPGASLQIVRNTATFNNALTILGTTPLSTTRSANLAGLYRSWGISQLPAGSPYSYQGWQEIDLGYLAQFKSGTTNGPPTTVGRNSTPTPSQIGHTNYSQATSGIDTLGIVPDSSTTSGWMTGNGTWTTTRTFWPGAIQQAAAFTANGGSGTFSGQWVKSPLVASGSAASLNLFGFSFPDLPDDVLINGIEVGVAGAVATGFGNLKCNTQIVVGQQASGSVKTAIFSSNSPTAPTQVVLGGSGDYWGVSTLTPSIIKNSGFGVRIQLVDGPGPSGPTASVLCGIYIKIYYQTSSSIYYFWNGTDDLSATIVTSNVDTGAWSTNNATGTFHVVNIQPVGSASRLTIMANDQVRTQPAGAGNLIATISSNMVYAGLPSLAQLQANSSQYEMINANFYGNKDWEAIYGVNGAGRAWTWDGFYFRYIYTGLNSTLDTPRHVAFHNFHLCLGYNSGALFTSATGAPEDFTGVNGAAEFDTADSITGLLRMNGTTLGIFCKKSIQGLNGTDNSNFSINILSPYEGAIEYTVVDCGKPVYTSFKGISVFDQTAAYGSFLGTRLSHLITPFLLPRINGTNQEVPVSAAFSSPINSIPSTINNSVAFAMPIRDKNQYRLWFRDGYYLTLTFSGTSMQDTSCTLGRVDFSTNESDILIPLAHSSSIDNNGLDRNHVSYYDPLRTSPTTRTDNRNYVWEINRGWGFGTTPVKAWFTTTHNFLQNPFQIATIRKIRLHGQSLGASSPSVAISADYLSNDFKYGNLYGQPQSNAPVQHIHLPRGWGALSAATYSNSYQPKTNIANVAKEGRSFSMQFAVDTTTVEPPVVAQSLFLHTTLNKADI